MVPKIAAGQAQARMTELYPEDLQRTFSILESLKNRREVLTQQLADIEKVILAIETHEVVSETLETLERLRSHAYTKPERF
jgi:hypothetical protein